MGKAQVVAEVTEIFGTAFLNASQEIGILERHFRHLVVSFVQVVKKDTRGFKDLVGNPTALDRLSRGFEPVRGRGSEERQAKGKE